ncbi:hypothetical protein KBD71_00765 [Candidatus Woesebacteria bacterium]|nr:hypothetical protein [Candidatus Woesebacteria bacterium]
MPKAEQEEHIILRHGINAALRSANIGLGHTASPKKFLEALNIALNVDVPFVKQPKGVRKDPVVIFKSRVIDVLSIAAKKVSLEVNLSPESTSEEILATLTVLLTQPKRG